MSITKKFIIKCPTCGEYEVEEDVFMAYLKQPLILKVRAKLAEGAIAAKLEFKDGCRKCQDFFITRGRLIIIKPPELSKN